MHFRRFYLIEFLSNKVISYLLKCLITYILI